MLAAPPQPSFTTAFLENKGASSSSSNSTPQLSPSVVVIIVLITVVFFLSGFLHLLARCFARPSPGGGLSRRHNNSSGSLVSQGQLQQLFQQHDAGVEQAFIDALPVFFYRSVRGLKDGADCAVCLNEFSGNDRLRLLPKCSHAFHLECIDEWLLSHSTCPLCRCSLLLVASDVSSASAWAGAVRVESLGRSSIVSGGSSSSGATSFAADSSSAAAAAAAANAGSGEIFVQELIQQQEQQQEQQQRVVPVKLGRFCPAVVDSSPIAASSRRSYSMGSYEYVLDASGDQTAVLVIAPTPIHRRWKAPGTPGHRSALSECIPEESSSSPWVTIDIDARPMLKSPPAPQLGASSILSWTPWKKSSDNKPASTAGGGGGGGASAALQAIKSFSFRIPAAIQQQQQQQASSQEQEGGDHVWWWKNGGNNSSRCLSESEQHHVGNGYYGNSSACSQWDQASVCSNAPSERKSSTGSVASSNTTSIARRTLQWLMGRESRQHQPRASAEDIPGLPH